MRRLVILLGAIVGMLGALALPALAGGGCHNTERSQGSGVAVEMVRCGFTPTILFIAPGSAITWTNRDPFEHDVVGIGWTSGARLAEGKSFTRTFSSPGIHPYTCTLHPGMAGTVVVGAVANDESAPAAPSAPSSAPSSSTDGAKAVRSSSSIAPEAIGITLLAGIAGFGLGRLRRKSDDTA